MRQVLVQHLALVVYVDAVVLAVGRQLVVLDKTGVFLEGVEVLDVVLLGKQRLGALFLVDAVSQVLVVRVEPEVLLVLLRDLLKLCGLVDPAGGQFDGPVPDDRHPVVAIGVVVREEEEV